MKYASNIFCIINASFQNVCLIPLLFIYWVSISGSILHVKGELQEKLLAKFFNFVWEVCFPEHTWEDLNKQACLSSLSNTNLGHGPKYGGTHTSCLDFSLCKIGKKSSFSDRIYPYIWLFLRLFSLYSS